MHQAPRELQSATARSSWICSSNAPQKLDSCRPCMLSEHSRPPRNTSQLGISRTPSRRSSPEMCLQRRWCTCFGCRSPCSFLRCTLLALSLAPGKSFRADIPDTPSHHWHLGSCLRCTRCRWPCRSLHLSCLARIAWGSSSRWGMRSQQGSHRSQALTWRLEPTGTFLLGS